MDNSKKSGIIKVHLVEKRDEPPILDEEDILDWDASFTPPPPKKSGTIKVHLVYGGRSKPIII